MADEERPATFGEVVEAFTPPGTDFEEFRAALHSQGAPGRIAPEMVLALNQIAPEMMAHTGPACPRCDHPHGGPPGRKCLEAEAHLGRSPSRRSPDLQLDAISASRAPRALEAAAPDFIPGMPTAGAVSAHEMYLDFRRAGFTLDEAVKLVAALISGANGAGSAGEEA